MHEELRQIPEEFAPISAMDSTYLSFRLSDQLYALSVSTVVQIISMQAITPIPEAAACIKGLINLRGHMIPVVDLRLRMGMPEASYDEKTCIIVCVIGQLHLGLIVDEVDAVLDIAPEQISPMPQMHENAKDYLAGLAQLADRVALLLALPQLIAGDAMERLVLDLQQE